MLDNIPKIELLKKKGEEEKFELLKTEDTFKFEFENPILNSSKVINENIERVWVFVRDFKNFAKNTEGIFADKGLFKGENSWTIGSVYGLYWIGITESKNRTIKIIDTEFKKMISFEVIARIGISFIFSFILFKINNNDTTLLKISINRHHNKNKRNKNVKFDITPYYSELLKKILINYENYIGNSLNLIDYYQSVIISKPINELLVFMSDIKNIENIFDNKFKIQKNGDIYETNTFLRFKVKNKGIYLKVLEVHKTLNNTKCILVFETIGSSSKITLIPRQEIKITFTKITNNETQVNIINRFYDKISKDYINIINLYIRNVLVKLKEYNLKE